MNQAEKQNEQCLFVVLVGNSGLDQGSSRFTGRSKVKVCRQLQSQKAERVDPIESAVQVFAEPPGDNCTKSQNGMRN